MKRRCFYKKVISERIYDFKGISRMLNLHIRTVQRFPKHGLIVEKDNSLRYLVEGKELKRFLKEYYNKERIKLDDDEFYCLKCKKACHSLPNEIKRVETHKKIGTNASQIIYHGLCEKCGSKVNRYSTDRKPLFNFKECQKGMIGVYEHNLNADITSVSKKNNMED